MPFNGSGVPTRLYNWVNDANAAIPITASRMDGDSNDFIGMFGVAFCRDGQAVATGDWNLGTHLIHNLGNGTAAQDAATVAQLQAGNLSYGGTAGGTANAITFNLSPPITAYAAGQFYSFKASAANTGAATVNINAVGVATLTRSDGTALQANDIKSGQIVEIEYDGTNFQVTDRNIPTVTGQLLAVQVFTASGTYTPTAGMNTTVVEMVGGGGASGQAAITTSGQASAGGGGGAGGYARLKLTAPASQSVTVGAGGVGATPSSGGSTIFGGTTCAGGSVGATGAVATPTGSGAGGAGGAVSGGTPIISITGQPGGRSFATSTAPGIEYGGAGGSSFLGWGGQADTFVPGSGGVARSPTPGVGYGSGGGGVASYSNSGTSTGGNGMPGIVIIYEYS